MTDNPKQILRLNRKNNAQKFHLLDIRRTPRGDESQVDLTDLTMWYHGWPKTKIHIEDASTRVVVATALKSLGFTFEDLKEGRGANELRIRVKKIAQTLLKGKDFVY